MHGNRDFVAGRGFEEATGARLIADPTEIDLYGTRTLLMHGDTLCTGDTAYQAFRTQTRDPRWQSQFLSQPLTARLAFAQQARAASRAHQSGLKQEGLMEAITDVAPATVDATMARFGIPRLIHGHTHRPKVHEHQGGRRIVLGDWYEQGSVLRMDAHGAELSPL
jgi:UDP-2,3-diacylglucosamine hydrolase